jgi:hypothetical protein
VSVAIGLCIAGIDRVSFWSTHVHESTVDAPLALDPGQRRTSDALTFERTRATATARVTRDATARSANGANSRSRGQRNGVGAISAGGDWGAGADADLHRMQGRVQSRRGSRAVTETRRIHRRAPMAELCTCVWRELVEHASGRGPSGDSSLIDCRCSRLRLPELGRQTGS